MTVWQSLHQFAAEIYEPDNAWGLAGLFVVNIGAILTAAGTVVLIVRQRSVKQALDKTNDQVINGHADTAPLRQDLDDKFSTVIAKLDGLQSMVGDHGHRLNSIEAHLRRK